MDEQAKNPVEPHGTPPGDPPPGNGEPLIDKIAPGTAPAAATPPDKGSPKVPAAAPAPPTKEKPAKDKAATPAEPKDGTREVIDTVVIVIVLVLLLKTFLAEAFVIPTGSMATTLLGYHQMETCPQCGHSFEVNYSKQADA